MESASGTLLFASQYNDGSGSLILVQIVNQIFQLAIRAGEELAVIR